MFRWTYYYLRGHILKLFDDVFKVRSTEDGFPVGYKRKGISSIDLR